MKTESPKTVLLHVGHGKTGSSFLQSALANSTAPLGRHEIAYPSARGNIAHTKAGGISSGNIVPTPRALLKALEHRQAMPCDKLLFSSEGLFYQMHRTGFLDTLRERLPDAELRVLLYIRDPLDHAVSSYHQTIKRGNGTVEFETALQTYNGVRLVADFLDLIEACGATLTIRNYSRHRDDLLGTFETWLGVPRGTLIRPPKAVVNRSLSNGEAAFLREFNTAFGKSGAQFLADPLCEQLPDIPAERPPARPEALGRFLERMRRVIDQYDLDARIPEGERYRLETPQEAASRFAAPQKDPLYGLRRSQIQLIAKLIIARMQERSDA